MVLGVANRAVVSCFCLTRHDTTHFSSTRTRHDTISCLISLTRTRLNKNTTNTNNTITRQILQKLTIYVISYIIFCKFFIKTRQTRITRHENTTLCYYRVIIVSNDEHEHDTTRLRVSYIQHEHDTNTNSNFEIVPISFRVVYFCRVVSTFATPSDKRVERRDERRQ